MNNEQIAKLIMKYTVYDRHENPEYFYAANLSACRINDFVEDVPDFLNDHNAAMMVVEKMREDGFVYEVDEAPCSRDYHVMFYGIDEHLIGDCEATSESLCHAICSSALTAKGIKHEDATA